MPNETQTENHEQRQVVKWLRANKIPCCAVTNSQAMSGQNRKRASVVQNMQKALGLAPGFPDLIVFLQDMLLCIEMKRVKGGTVSKLQHHWIKTINKFSYAESVICHGHEEAIQTIKDRM